jgi:hypothetical protein
MLDNHQEGGMRTLILGAILLAVVGFVGFQISASVIRDAKAATFSERFAPALNQAKKPTDV